MTELGGTFQITKIRAIMSRCAEKEYVSGETILIVDDEECVRKSLADVMRDEGYGVVTAASGREGIELLNETQPSLALLDIRKIKVLGIGVED